MKSPSACKELSVKASHHTDRVGVHKVAALVHEQLGWIFREQHEDFGVDGQIEVVSDGIPTGRLIAVQIKSGPSYVSESSTRDFTFRGKTKHLDYWLKHDLPVIVVIYNPKTNVAYWQSVTVEHAARTSNGWKMVIPESQRLEPSQSAALRELAQRQQQLKDTLNEFHCPYCGSTVERQGEQNYGGGNIAFCREFACGYWELNDSMQRPCVAVPGYPKFEDYTLTFFRHSIAADEAKKWCCWARGKTPMAKMVDIGLGVGRTKHQAAQHVQKRYNDLRKHSSDAARLQIKKFNK